MLRVGKSEILHVENFILLNGEEAFLELNNKKATAKFRIRFLEDSSSEKTSTNIEPDPDDADRGLLTFTNWNKAHRVATTKPIAVMENETHDLFLMASVTYSHGSYQVLLQFTEEEKK